MKKFKFNKKKSGVPLPLYYHENPFLGAMGVTIACLQGHPCIPVGTVANRIRFEQMDNCACRSIELADGIKDLSQIETDKIPTVFWSYFETKYELWAVTEVIKSYITEISDRVSHSPEDKGNFNFTLDITPVLTKVYNEGLKGNEKWFETYATFCNNVQANIEEWAKSFGFSIVGSIEALTLLV